MNSSANLDLGPARSAEVVQAVRRVFKGHDQALEIILTGLTAGGHVLIEGVPGVGKTTLAKAIADATGLHFTRIQLTPDLLPADLVGHSYWNPSTSAFETRKGPVFTNVLMADELNRTPPRTQAALLEVMQESQVTIEGKTFPLPQPFLVIATKNPIEIEGVYRIPEAELDRFMLHVTLTYPSRAESKDLLTMRAEPAASVHSVPGAVQAMQAAAAAVTIHADIQDYILDLADATRNHPEISLGASPRAAEHLQTASRAAAALAGRTHVIPDDVKRLVPNVFGHRLILTPDAEAEDRTAYQILEDILARTPAPVTPKETA